MAYSDFTLKSVSQIFGLTTTETTDLFSLVPAITLSHSLEEDLAEYSPLGLTVGTEKARSEFIIAPILAEARKLKNKQVSLFSGIDFSIAPEQGLKGTCDYIFSLSPHQYYIVAPALFIVEAKKEDISGGLGQCIAEMVAAQIFNEREGTSLETIYGAVTTGSEWKFLQLEQKAVTIDSRLYYLAEIEKILGILLHILQDDRQEHALAA